MATRRRPQLRWQPRMISSRHVLMSKRGRRLEALFDEERMFGKNGDFPPVVVLNAAGPDDNEEVSGVETEMLRAECRFLRMERELALKKMRRRMERVLRSALQTLVSGRDKLDAGGAGKGVCESLDEEIEAMRSKLLELQTVTSSRTKIFDANLDEHRLPDHHIPIRIQQLAGASFQTDEDIMENSSRFIGVALSKAGRERSSVASSASTEMSLPSIPQELHQEEEGEEEEEQPCSGRCREVVRRVAEQVRFETEQWSQVQEMLEKVKEEMEQLQTAKDKWQQQALFSQDHIFSLNSTVEAWKKRASHEEAKVNDLKTQLRVLQEELKMANEGARANSSSLKNSNSKGQGDLREDKKKLQVQKRPPFLDIGNSSPLMRQITKVVFPGHKIYR